MAKHAIYKNGRWRKYPHGGAYASKADIRAEFREKGYKILKPEKINPSWRTGTHVQKNVIDKVGGQKVYTRNTMALGYDSNDLSVEYRIWIITEEEIDNPRRQLKKRMNELMELHEPKQRSLRSKMIQDTFETNAEVPATAVDKETGVWHGTAVYDNFDSRGNIIPGRSEEYHAKSGPKRHDIKQQTLFAD